MNDRIQQNDYEIISKHCPRCESLVMAAVVRTSAGEVYKYRDVKCSRCDWNTPSVSAERPR
ncbi:MAG TPA: hypothetical protein PKO25_14495 [Spirochaetota bacterium]|nr:hypothetical protein [Spirochaetota bacterium]OPZ36313.1 MAG: hypothetical protein BWY96_02312 [Spirochaetes bacterium ADurb.BinA120]HNU93080.1 hypothetical protein [Spirochaetota bacterium]HPI15785.1 hypothetical protein [Spirochaetota bacterium]HPO45227.1 hypothetical protein [Spirochaetota bacterium]